ncbi:uncharacterized protein I303_105995 [Kwoniella dejecticola CBS 10117]|uniref:Chromatin modification-related protein n=1 Tax=Kwoniella dejecticola CBS 10117 TaxID=1296121 RepID=A0A1A6A102_9TREE|nr:uncharacterized protein I303_06015 [Kwoniella dejecticola CBS 10117]OBR83735.1 hypothetical protein I303_06015 [Kwoniella dejecticola CBS 10117]
MPPRKSLPTSFSTPARLSRQEPSSQSTIKRSRSRKPPAAVAALGSSPDPIALKAEVPVPSRSRTRGNNQQHTQDVSEEVQDDIQVVGEMKANSRRSGRQQETAPKNETKPGEEMSNEKENETVNELEAWEDFAADHYEMVEQLPLELHRNFRLLRELDDGCIAQTKRLHELIRHYVNERLELEKQLLQRKSSNSPASNEGEQAEQGVKELDDKDKNEKEGEAQKIDKVQNPKGNDTSELNHEQNTDNPEKAEDDMEMILGAEQVVGEHAKEAARDVQVDRDLLEGKQVTKGVPLSDGQGGLLIPIPLPSNSHSVNGSSGESEKVPMPVEILPRLGFPPRPEDGGAEEDNDTEKEKERDDEHNGNTEDATSMQVDSTQDKHQSIPAENGTSQVDGADSKEREKEDGNKKRKRPDGPYAHLPEIARLSREVIRTAEEKVAVAVGAYNAIDRHIRALDSALTAQEASILLGLRPETLPSTNAEDALNPSPTEEGGDGHEAEEGEMIIGLGGMEAGGGTGKRSRKKGRKGKKGMRNGVNVGKEQPHGGQVGQGQGQVAGKLPGQGGVGHGVEGISVDPNEPRYCYCHQVSYGQMIGCENEDCPLEWFHLACCGLDTAPTGTWYCDLCKADPGVGKAGNKVSVGHPKKKR